MLNIGIVYLETASAVKAAGLPASVFSRVSPQTVKLSVLRQAEPEHRRHTSCCASQRRHMPSGHVLFSLSGTNAVMQARLWLQTPQRSPWPRTYSLREKGLSLCHGMWHSWPAQSNPRLPHRPGTDSSRFYGVAPISRPEAGLVCSIRLCPRPSRSSVRRHTKTYDLCLQDYTPDFLTDRSGN